MTSATPLKRLPASGQPTSVAEFTATDSVPVTNGGTGLTTIAINQLLYTSALNTLAATSLTAFGRSLIDDADAATCRTTLGFTAPILDKASPGAIGGTTPSSISCTDFTSTGIDDNATTTALTIDSSLNVMVGDGAPEAWDSAQTAIQFGELGALMASSTTSNTVQLIRNAYFDGAWKYINSDEAQRINLAQDGRISFEVATSGTADTAITWDDVLEIQNTGVVSLQNGQLKFPAAQNASADANTLDDYEEGTWTIGVEDSSSNVSASTGNGQYRKVGAIVHCWFALSNIDTTGLTGTDTLRITGLPFTSSTAAGSPRYMGTIDINRFAASTDNMHTNIRLSENVTYMELSESYITSGANSSLVTVNQLIDDLADIYGHITYPVLT